MQEKSHLRTKFKNLRKGIDTESVSEAICKNIRDFEPYKKAENVMLFQQGLKLIFCRFLMIKKNSIFRELTGKNLKFVLILILLNLKSPRLI